MIEVPDDFFHGHCDFCDKPAKDVKVLIKGPGMSSICADCIDFCTLALEKFRNSEAENYRLLALTLGVEP